MVCESINNKFPYRANPNFVRKYRKKAGGEQNSLKYFTCRNLTESLERRKHTKSKTPREHMFSKCWLTAFPL